MVDASSFDTRFARGDSCGCPGVYRPFRGAYFCAVLIQPGVAAEYFSGEQIERGMQFSHERKLLVWCGTGLQLALLTALVCTTLSRRVTDFFDRWTGRRWLLTLAAGWH